MRRFLLLIFIYASLGTFSVQAQEPRKFTLMAHRPNYFLPITYNSNPNNNPYQDLGDPSLDNAEAKFQISFKVPVVSRLYFAYTQLAFWQVYNRDVSSPFRDTNYEPEFFADFDKWQIGWAHQSNGRTDPFSRSWNRVYAQYTLQKDAFLMMIKPWYRIPEDDDEDNNSDIHRYMGYGELRFAYAWKEQVFAALVRNNLNANDNKGAFELTWSAPLTTSVKLYLQYFNGYGECLLDYNHYNNRIGIGFAISDWM